MKYPRTPHLPWSPGGTSDDKRMLDVGPLLGDVVITEKMDGSNVALSRENFFARSHAQVPVHRSFDLVRVADSFRDFRTSVAKWVRKDHVQTDVHWSHQAIRKQNMA
jgi:hypothetical protein